MFSECSWKRNGFFSAVVLPFLLFIDGKGCGIHGKDVELLAARPYPL